MTEPRAHGGDALSALLDGELGPLAAEQLQVHLAACEDCRAELEAVREARLALRSLPAVEPPSGYLTGLLLGGLPEPAERRRRAKVLPLRRRRTATAHAAAAVVAGLALVVGYGGQGVGAVVPEVDGAVARHAATVSAVAVGGRTAPDPLLEPGAVPPGTAPHRSWRVSRPYAAPDELAGYELAGVFQAPRGLHLLYRKGSYGLSVFEQEGRIAAGDLPPAASELDVDGRPAWRWERGHTAGRVLMMQQGNLLVTFVGDESADAVLAAARAFSGSGSASWPTRLRRACGEALDTLSPAG